MKRLIFVLVAVLVAVACIAQPTDVDVIYNGMIPQTITWPDVVTDIEGNPILDTDVITYEVFITKAPFDPAEAVSLGVVLDSEVTIDISMLTRGYYYVGVRSVGTTAEGEVGLSFISWSNDPASVDPTQRFALIVTAGFLPANPAPLNFVSP